MFHTHEFMIMLNCTHVLLHIVLKLAIFGFLMTDDLVGIWKVGQMSSTN